MRVRHSHPSKFFNHNVMFQYMKEPVGVCDIQVNIIVPYSQKNLEKVHDYLTEKVGCLQRCVSDQTNRQTVTVIQRNTTYS